VEDGLNYARELVEFTTSVKKAKFYRQLADRGDERESRSVAPHSTTILNPLDAARGWLTSSDIGVLREEVDQGRSALLTKHEELTIIHEDLARFRVRSLRRDIRTDAVDTAENWAIAAEFFDDETGQHCYRVGHLTGLLAREIGLDESYCLKIEHAARLHDIGKIAVNEVILLKPGPLDAAEMAAMRLHTEVGAQILSGSDDPTLRIATEIARHHHEWWNGNGYPSKLIGAEIPISARLCAYADVYDALTHARAYKKAWTHERALAEMQRLHGTQFDPGLMKPFCNVLDRYRADLELNAIPGFVDMETNALIASRKKLMTTISAQSIA
jgi:putative nucleotidyltransferase with HDIG domain